MMSGLLSIGLLSEWPSVRWPFVRLAFCPGAVEALSSSRYTDLCSLIKLKSAGHLICPSTDVVDICLTCESNFRKYVLSPETGKLSNVECHKIVQQVLLQYVGKPIFASLNDHMLECDPQFNHIILLIKAVAEKYLQVRYYYAGKTFTASMHEKNRNKSRQTLTKLVLFTGQ